MRIVSAALAYFGLQGTLVATIIVLLNAKLVIDAVFG